MEDGKGLLFLIVLSFTLFSAGGQSCEAATFYVKPNGTSGNGTTWSSAWVGFSNIKWGTEANQVGPGDTLCIAGGSYTKTLTAGIGGTTGAPITIKRATASDPACNESIPAGADSQVYISAGNLGLEANVSYVVVDGMVDSGIKIKYATGFQAGLAVGGMANIVRSVELEGPGVGYNYTAACANGLALGGSGHLISHLNIHGSDTLITTDASDVIIEHSKLWGASGNSQCHGNIAFVGGSDSINGTFRYNDISQMNAEGIFFTGWGGSPSNWKVYGNVFHDSLPGFGRGIEIRQDYSYSGFEIYNNTFVNLDGGGILNRAPETGHHCSNCIAKNNLSVSAGNTLDGLINSNNIDDSTNRFIDVTGGDYHLKASTSAGASLPAPYNVDGDGNKRGADGVWDIGAFEFLSGARQPSAPRALRIVP